MATLKELSYRTFDQLLNSVLVDFASFNMDNQVEPAELIKVAQQCTWKLGLKIYQTKETILEIDCGRAKLPADFYMLNNALLCDHYHTVTPSIANGIQGTAVRTGTNVPNLTTCPCWTVVSTGTQVTVKFCDGTIESVFYPAGTTKVCALSFDTANAHGGTITVSTDSFCYNDYNTGTFTCNPPGTTCDCPSPLVDTCGVVNADPWFQNRVYSICDGTVGVKVVQQCNFEVREYTQFEKLYIVPSKQATSFCLNTQFRDCENRAQIKQGYLQMLPHNDRREYIHDTVPHQGGWDNWGYPNSGESHHLHNGKVYICYEGDMIDDEGNLLVLDHPVINMYYEWALKERILDNLYLNGEPDIERRLGRVDKKLREAYIDATSIIDTPDYREVILAIEGNRQNNYTRYTKPFERLYYPYTH